MPAAAVTAIVLSGGQSSRMGRDKAQLSIDRETFLERAVRIARDVADDVMVIARGSQQIPPHTRRIDDPIENLGPLAGICEGLSASHTDLNIVMACDMPLIKPAVLRRLVESIGPEDDVCVAVVDGHASVLCAVYRARLARLARQLLDQGERRVTALVDRVQTKRVDAAQFRDIDPNLDTFFSCDTPEAYRRLKAEGR